MVVYQNKRTPIWTPKFALHFWGPRKGYPLFGKPHSISMRPTRTSICVGDSKAAMKGCPYHFEQPSSEVNRSCIYRGQEERLAEACLHVQRQRSTDGTQVWCVQQHVLRFLGRPFHLLDLMILGSLARIWMINVRADEAARKVDLGLSQVSSVFIYP